MRWSLCVLLTIVAIPAGAFTRNHVEVTGSSTVFPFTATVANNVRRLAGVSVVSKSTGTGGGIQAFCSGSGDEWPDVTGASRPMTEGEHRRCQQNDVRRVTELIIGYDGIVIANSSRSPKVGFTREHLHDALAQKVVRDGRLVANPYQKWHEIDGALPDRKIMIIGPPSTSGTRNTFEQLAIKPPCIQLTSGIDLPAEQLEEACTAVRRDGPYVELGEDDVEIIKQLNVTPEAFGIFGYSYVLRYRDIVQPNMIDGVMPSPENIENGSYPLSRPLFLYVKNDRLRSVAGLAEFLKEFVSDQALGPEGYLVDEGLVPLNAELRATVQSTLIHLLEK
ncbi:MAG: substrate-binding domain-containing protein [Deltaproteobacteria bacterium]|nr:substrate-binding domain-containing protein [Deltaproteobacteria bacterium]